MATKPFVAARVGDAASAGNLIANILQASTEYSITGKNLDGTALLWNESVRCPLRLRAVGSSGESQPRTFRTYPRMRRGPSRAVGLFSNHLRRQRATKGGAHVSHLFKTLAKTASRASFDAAENKYAVP